MKIMFTFATQKKKQTSPDGGIGRRAGLKHQWSNIHPGSTPGLGTIKELNIQLFFLYIHIKKMPYFSPIDTYLLTFAK